MFPRLKDIKKIRERIGWSQVEIAKYVGVSQSAITKYENGTQIPSYEIGTKIFDVLLAEVQRVDPKVSELMSANVITVDKLSKFGKTLDIMKNKAISQVPVTYKSNIVGTVSESNTLDLIDQYHNITRLRDEIVEDIMGESLPIVPMSTRLKEISPLLRHFGSVLISQKGTIKGIITKADLLEMPF